MMKQDDYQLSPLFIGSCEKHGNTYLTKLRRELFTLGSTENFFSATFECTICALCFGEKLRVNKPMPPPQETL